jgi:hypothetical protein
MVFVALVITPNKKIVYFGELMRHNYGNKHQYFNAGKKHDIHI